MDINMLMDTMPNVNKTLCSGTKLGYASALWLRLGHHVGTSDVNHMKIAVTPQSASH